MPSIPSYLTGAHGATLGSAYGLEAPDFAELLAQYGESVRWWKAIPPSTRNPSNFVPNRRGEGDEDLEAGMLYAEQSLEWTGDLSLPAPLVAPYPLSSGTGLSSGYRYAYTWSNTLGESALSTPSSPLTLPAPLSARGAHISGFLVPPLGSIERITLYRKKDGELRWRQVGAWDVGARTTWDDSTDTPTSSRLYRRGEGLVARPYVFNANKKWAGADGVLLTEGDALIDCMPRDFEGAMPLENPDRILTIAREEVARERIERASTESDILKRPYVCGVYGVLDTASRQVWSEGVHYQVSFDADNDGTYTHAHIRWLAGEGPLTGESYTVEYRYHPLYMYAGERQTQARRDMNAQFLPLRGALTLIHPQN